MRDVEGKRGPRPALRGEEDVLLWSTCERWRSTMTADLDSTAERARAGIVMGEERSTSDAKRSSVTCTAYSSSLMSSSLLFLVGEGVVLDALAASVFHKDDVETGSEPNDAMLSSTSRMSTLTAAYGARRYRLVRASKGILAAYSGEVAESSCSKSRDCAHSSASTSAATPALAKAMRAGNNSAASAVDKTARHLITTFLAVAASVVRACAATPTTARKMATAQAWWLGVGPGESTAERFCSTPVAALESAAALVSAAAALVSASAAAAAARTSGRNEAKAGRERTWDAAEGEAVSARSKRHVGSVVEGGGAAGEPGELVMRVETRDERLRASESASSMARLKLGLGGSEAEARSKSLPLP